MATLLSAAKDMYQVQDMCWEDFALSQGQSVRRTPHVQQILGFLLAGS